MVIRYRADLAAREVQAVKRFVGENRAIIAAPDAGQTEPVRAFGPFRRLSCSEVDLRELKTFSDNRFAAPS